MKVVPVITEPNIKLLAILDELELVKITEANLAAGIYIKFIQLLGQLNQAEIEEVVKLSLNYSPRTRTLLGIFLAEMGGQTKLTEIIRQSLISVSAHKTDELNNKID